MNSNRTLLAAAGALALLTSAAVVTQTAVVNAADGVKTPDAVATVGPDVTAAKGHFANAAFSQPARPAGGGQPTAKASADPGVVVTYDNNRSSVVVTGHDFGFDRPAAPGAPAKHDQ